MCQKWTARHIALVDLRPLNPSHCTALAACLHPPQHTTHPSLKPGQGTRTVSPEKATGSQETAPLPDHSQEISAAQSQSSCSARTVPHPSPEARSGEGRPGWFTSSALSSRQWAKFH
uniref:Uncharacterized protein n=1 Tax=Sus scrofa TaxID=9823 RepID=A0A8D1UXT6_PIG